MDMGPIKPRQLRESATCGGGKIDRGSSDPLNLLGLWRLDGPSCGTGKTARG